MEKTNNVTAIGLVSMFMQFGCTLIYTTSPNFLGEKLFKDPMLFLLIRNVGESTGIFYKLLSGYLSDIINNRKTFLYVGYGTVIIFKGLFFLVALDVLCPKYATIVFVFAHLMDRMMNSIRDAPRDALLFASTEEKNQSFAKRKIIGTTGSILGGLLCIFLIKFNKVNPSILYGFALLPILISNIILYFTVKDICVDDQNNQHIENKISINPYKLLEKFANFVINTLFYLLMFYYNPLEQSLKINILKIVYFFLSSLVIYKENVTNMVFLQSFFISIVSFLTVNIFIPINYRFITECLVFPLFMLIMYNFFISSAYKSLGKYDLKPYIIFIVCSLLLSMAKLNDSLYFKVGEIFNLGGDVRVSMIIMFTINYLCQMTVSILAKKFNLQYGKKTYLQAMIAMFILCNALCYYANNTVHSLILAILLGIVNVGYDLVISSMICKYIVNEQLKGTMFGIFYFITGFSNIFSTLFMNKMSTFINLLNPVLKIQYTALFCIPFAMLSFIVSCFL